MKVEDLRLKMFENVEALQDFIKKNFNVEAMQQRDNDEFEIDDEVDFMDGELDYSIYYMTGKSGRIIVVEIDASPY